jgi:hypothetical protein
VLAFVLALLLATPIEVERVLALVGSTPVLASDAELAELAGLVPREPGETDDAYRRAVVDALIALELRWQDLTAAGLRSRVQADLDGAWEVVAKRAGGEQALRARLTAIGLGEAELRGLVERAVVVQTYALNRFAPFVRPTDDEVETFYRRELVPELERDGRQVPPLDEVRASIEPIVRERKLSAEVERWTAELAARTQVQRYVR